MALTTDPVTGRPTETVTAPNAVAATGRERIVAMFETLTRAREVRDRLRDAGVPASDIQILNREATEADATIKYERTNEGFWSALKNLFVPEREAPVYTEGLQRGQAMLIIDPPAGRHEEIIRLVEGYDPVDLEEREREWRAAGWTTSAGMTGHGELGRNGADRPAVDPNIAAPSVGDTAAMTGAGLSADERDAELRRSQAAMATGSSAAGERAIPVVEEELTVGKRAVDRGKVRVRSFVTERPVEETVTLHEERVNVERRPVNRPAGRLPEEAFREREIEVTAKGEEPVVRKDARVVEEVVVNKEDDTRTETVRDKVRRTDVNVEDNRTGNAAVPTPPAGKPPRR